MSAIEPATSATTPKIPSVLRRGMNPSLSPCSQPGARAPGGATVRGWATSRNGQFCGCFGRKRERDRKTERDPRRGPVRWFAVRSVLGLEVHVSAAHAPAARHGGSVLLGLVGDDGLR